MTDAFIRKHWSHPWLLFPSFPSWDPPVKPVNSTFKIFLAADFFPPPLLLCTGHCSGTLTGLLTCPPEGTSQHCHCCDPVKTYASHLRVKAKDPHLPAFLTYLTHLPLSQRQPHWLPCRVPRTRACSPLGAFVMALSTLAFFFLRYPHAYSFTSCRFLLVCPLTRKPLMTTLKIVTLWHCGLSLLFFSLHQIYQCLSSQTYVYLLPLPPPPRWNVSSVKRGTLLSLSRRQGAEKSTD